MHTHTMIWTYGFKILWISLKLDNSMNSKVLCSFHFCCFFFGFSAGLSLFLHSYLHFIWYSFLSPTETANDMYNLFRWRVKIQMRPWTVADFIRTQYTRRCIFVFICFLFGCCYCSFFFSAALLFSRWFQLICNTKCAWHQPTTASSLDKLLEICKMNT